MEYDDPVLHPAHYNHGEIETIDVIQDKLTTAEFEGYCMGNALKYITRARHKHNFEEDIRKAVWYLRRMLERFGSDT